MVLKEYMCTEDLLEAWDYKIEDDDTDDSDSEDESESESSSEEESSEEDSDEDDSSDEDDDSEKDDESEEKVEEKKELEVEEKKELEDTRPAHEIRQDLIRGIQDVSTDLDYLLKNLHKDYNPIGIPKLNPSTCLPYGFNRGHCGTPTSPQMNHYDHNPNDKNRILQPPRTQNYGHQQTRSSNYQHEQRPYSQQAQWTPKPQPLDAASLYSRHDVRRSRKAEPAWDQRSTFSQDLKEYSRRLNRSSEKKKFRPRNFQRQLDSRNERKLSSVADLYKRRPDKPMVGRTNISHTPQSYPDPAIPTEDLCKTATSGRANIRNNKLLGDQSFKVTEAELIKKASNILLESENEDVRNQGRRQGYERQIASFM